MDARDIMLLYNDDDESNNEIVDLFLIRHLLMSVPRPKMYSRSFQIDKMTDKECRTKFRFNKEHVVELANIFLPEHVPNRLRIRVGRVEGMCILLRRLAYPNRLVDTAPLFERHINDISLITNTVLDIIFDGYCGRLNTLSHPWMDTARLAQKIREKGSPLDNCIGFLDGTVRPIARPSQNQRDVYSGHKRIHGIKFQSVMLPNGIIGHMYGPMPGRRHDSALLANSGLLQEMEEHTGEHCLYGDQAYPMRRHLITPFKGATLTLQQEEFNIRMSALRICVEWGFGKIIQQFAFLDFKKNQKLLLQPVGKYYLVGTLLTNCHTCLYGSQTTTYFDCSPPTLRIIYINYFSM